MSDRVDLRFAATAAAVLVFANSSMPAPRLDGDPSHGIPLQIQGLPRDHSHVPDVEIQQAIREPVLSQITNQRIQQPVRRVRTALGRR
jgi:hypothetical protein